MSTLNPYLILIILATSTFFLYYLQKAFILKGRFDKKNIRSSHDSIATRSGGLAIFLNIFLISTYFYLNSSEVFDFSLLIPLMLLVVVGLYDDVYDMDFKLKFIFQIIAAKIFIDNGLIIDNLHGVLGIYELGRIAGQILTIFIIISIINAINFIDGIDGLALSIVIIFLISFEFFASGISPFLIFTQIIILTCVPLFYFNLRSKNKVFLGDSGSLFLGGIVSAYVIFILSNNYIIKTEFDLHKILFVLSVLIYPIIDIIRVFFLRLYNKRSPFQADKNHIHHLLLKKSKSHVKTTLMLVFISIIFLIFIQIIF